jgi:hypothetical protein
MAMHQEFDGTDRHCFASLKVDASYRDRSNLPISRPKGTYLPTYMGQVGFYCLAFAALESRFINFWSLELG